MAKKKKGERKKAAAPAAAPAGPPRDAGREAALGKLDALLPYAILAVAAAAIFLTQNFKIGFETGHHGFLSSHGATLARNLSFKTNLLLYHAADLEPGGKVGYEVYNRFPVLPFAVVKLAMAPFEPDLARQVYAARQTMNAFLVLALLFCFLAMKEVTGKRYAALVAALLLFSSFYLLYYGDMIFNDIPALFGFSLALWLAARAQRPGLRTPLLVLVPVVSISMGWQAYGAYAAWAAIEAVRNVVSRERSVARVAKEAATIALAAAIAWGVALLGTQILVEARMAGTSFWEAPSIGMAKFRLGAAAQESYAQFSRVLAWPFFLEQQWDRLVTLFVPAAWIKAAMSERGPSSLVSILVLLSIAAGIGRIFTLKGFPAKRLAGAMVLSGILWSIPMKHFVAFHDFQTIFYVGIPLAAFGGIGLFFRGQGSRIAAVAALLFLIYNVNLMNADKEKVAGFVNPLTYEFQAICAHLPPGSRVFIDGDKYTIAVGYHSVNFYLAGRIFAPLEEAEYVISANPYRPGRRLTSNNYLNLFAK